MVAGREVEGWEEATVSGTCGPAEAGLRRPHGSAVAHGGPLCWRGSWRITTSTPCPQCGQSRPAWRGQDVEPEDWLSWSGDARGAGGC